jgi:hypothetical protein
MLTGGTVGAGPAAIGAFSAVGRSVLQQPASSVAETRSAIEAVRNAMNGSEWKKRVATIVSRKVPACQDARIPAGDVPLFIFEPMPGLIRERGHLWLAERCDRIVSIERTI